jgi:transposase
MELLKYGVGIDIAKNKFDACISVINSEQYVSIKATHCFENNRTGFENFLKWVRKYRKLDLPMIFLMEATGIYYEQLSWFLHNNNCKVSVVLANKAKKYKDSLGLRSKTDSIDAKALAQMCCQQQHTIWNPISQNLYVLRLITRQIQSISEEITVFNNQLEVMQYGMFRDKSIEKMISKNIALMKKTKKALQLRVENIISSDDCLKAKFDKILGIKGLGLHSLAIIVAETNGFTAFESISQLVSYAGYDIIENQSGKRVGKTRISKKGNNHIRRALFFPALNMIKYEVNPFFNLYQRIYDRNRIKMKGITAVQKKLLCLIYTLWKKDEAFDPTYNKITSRDQEPESSFGSVPKELSNKKINRIGEKKVAPIKTRATQDKHPSTSRRMSSFG